VTDDAAVQQRLHEAIEAALAATGDLEDGSVLASWIVVWESATLGERQAVAGHLYGPSGMTTWRALGLVEWARRFGLMPDAADG
jgi:hypothetical protein